MKAAEIIKRNRTKRQMSQGDLAKYLNYGNGQFISNWERGLSLPPINKTRELAKLLGIGHEKLARAIIKEKGQQLWAAL